eukprot:scaffold95218_cov17-Tisochrysis_lutea.AAC.1
MSLSHTLNIHNLTEVRTGFPCLLLLLLLRRGWRSSRGGERTRCGNRCVDCAKSLALSRGVSCPEVSGGWVLLSPRLE